MQSDINQIKLMLSSLSLMQIVRDDVKMENTGDWGIKNANNMKDINHDEISIEILDDGCKVTCIVCQTFFTLSSGETHIVIFSESSLFSEIYTNPVLYNDIGKEMCIAIDVVLGASGCEAVVEGFYSLVKTYEKNGGQSNTSLVQRSIVDWALPHPIQCPNTVRKITMLYTNGDPSRGLKKHRDVRFFDACGRASSKYSVSKVVDRLAQESSRCPHIIHEDI